MRRRELCSALLAWIGHHLSEPLLLSYDRLFEFGLDRRVREKLRSGEMRVSGYHWPIFLYADQTYDEEDPWTGLMRSQLLVMVCSLCFPHLVSSSHNISGLQTHLYLTKFRRRR